MLSMYSHAFAEHGKAREAWEAWGNHGLPMNSMLFPMLPIPGWGLIIRYSVVQIVGWQKLHDSMSITSDGNINR